MLTIQKIMESVAKREFENSKGHLYDYDIFDSLYTGICEIQNISYNPVFKNFDMVLKDIDTYNTMCIERCHVRLKRRA